MNQHKVQTTMMKQTVDEFNRAGSKMAGDIRTVIADGEELLKAAADVSGEGFAAARVKFEEKFANARARLATRPGWQSRKPGKPRPQLTLTCIRVRGRRSVSPPRPAC